MYVEFILTPIKPRGYKRMLCIWNSDQIANIGSTTIGSRLYVMYLIITPIPFRISV